MVSCLKVQICQNPGVVIRLSTASSSSFPRAEFARVESLLETSELGGKFLEKTLKSFRE